MMAQMGTGQAPPQLALESPGQGTHFQFGVLPQQLASSSNSAPVIEDKTAQLVRMQEEERKRQEAEHAARLQLQIQNEAQRIEEENQRKQAEEQSDQKRALDKLQKLEDKRKEDEAKQKKKEEAEAKEKERKASEALRGGQMPVPTKPETTQPPDNTGESSATREHSRSPPGKPRDTKTAGKEKEEDRKGQTPNA